ncbi:MAG TPA: YbjN domain-containing protein [Caulobacteraceae bacterium]|jgi:hypothetical protein
MTRVILALLLCGAAAAPALAQPAAEPTTVIRWDTGQLVNVLQSLGTTEIRTGDSGGKPALTARTRDGLSVGLYGKGCDPATPPAAPVCHGIEGVISFDASQKPERATLVEHLNHDYALGKFMSEPDGTIRVSRYFLLDGGISEDNLRAELNGYFTVGVLAGRAIWPQAPAH